MKRKQALLTATAVVIIIAGAAFLTEARFDGKKGEPPVRDRVAVSVLHEVTPSSGHAPQLISRAAPFTDDEIDPKFKRPLQNGWYEVIRTGDFRPPGNALDFVKSQLILSSAGSAAATYNIFLALLSCSNSFRNNELVDENSNHALQDCESLLTDSDISSVNWLAKAAEQGSLEAQLMYANSAKNAVGGPEELLRHPEKVIEWKRESISYLEEAASRGSADAISSLSEAYERGVLTDPDPVRSYAYLLASSQISPSPYTNELLTTKEAELTSPQKHQAALLAKKVLNNCCKP